MASSSWWQTAALHRAAALDSTAHAKTFALRDGIDSRVDIPSSRDSARRRCWARCCARGYGAAQVLGPFDGRDGAVEYTVTLYTGRALRWQATLRGDYPTLHARIAALPPPA